MTQPVTAEARGHPGRDDQEYLVTEEVGDLLRTPPETVRFWRHTGKGPRSFKVGRRVLYARADVEAFITQARQGAQ